MLPSAAAKTQLPQRGVENAKCSTSYTFKLSNTLLCFLNSSIIFMHVHMYILHVHVHVGAQMYMYMYMYFSTLAPPPTQPTPLQPAGPTPPEGPPLPALSSLRALLPSTEGSPRHDPGSLQHPSAQREEEAEQAELADVQHHACRVPLTAPLLVPPPLQNLLSQGHPLTSPTPQHHTAVSSLLRSVTRLVYTGFDRQDTEGGRERGRGREWGERALPHSMWHKPLTRSPSPSQ